MVEEVGCDQAWVLGIPACWGTAYCRGQQDREPHNLHPPGEGRWGLNQGGEAGSSEKKVASGNTVTFEPTGFADGLSV